MLVLTDLEQTGVGAPSRWSGRTLDGRPVDIRYRWGSLTVRVGDVGQSDMDARGGEIVFDGDIPGDRLGSVCDWCDVVAQTGIIAEHWTTRRQDDEAARYAQADRVERQAEGSS